MSTRKNRDDTYGMTVGSDTVDDWYFEYDGDGRMTKELLATSSATYPYVFALGQRNVEFDAAGRRTKLWFSSANRTGYLNLTTNQVYSYDSTKHRLTQIQRESDSGQKAQYSYDDSDGRVTKVTYGNGARAEYGHDASGALTKISHFSNGGTTIGLVAYSYDKAGNVTKALLDDALTYNGDATVYYYYDNLHRLTREYCSPGQGSYRSAYDYRYEYDAVGNREDKYEYSGGDVVRQDNYSYSTSNELRDLDEWWYEGEDLHAREWTLEYDLRGNLTKKSQDGYWINYEEQEVDLPFTDYYWDSRDLMTKVQYGYVDPYYGPSYGSAVQYKYDVMGRRVAKKLAGGSWKWFFYDGLKVIAEGTGTNDKMFYTLAPGAIGGIISRDNNGTKYWYHYDRLGNVMAVTDTNGSPYAVYTMDAFGNVLEKGTSTGYSSEHGTDPQPYHLTTREYDPDSQLYYFNARWYDGATARFLSRALLRSDVEHPYAYCESNPLSMLDPSGQEACSISGTVESLELTRLSVKAQGIMGPTFCPGGRLGIGIVGIIYKIRAQAAAKIKCKKTCKDCEEATEEWEVPLSFPLEAEVTLGFGVTLGVLNYCYNYPKMACDVIKDLANCAEFVGENWKYFPFAASALMATIDLAPDKICQGHALLRSLGGSIRERFGRK